MLTPARIAVLVSGGGTNLQALLDAQRDGKMPHGEIVLVVSSRAGAYALTRAENAGVAARVLTPSCGQEPFENELSVLLREQEIDLILLAGFTVILSAEFTKQWPRRILMTVWLPVIIAASIALGIFIGNHYLSISQGKKRSYSSGNKINAILDIIDEQYVDTVSMSKLVESTIPKIFSELDPHSVYIPAEDASVVNEELEGSFSGIGVSFNMQTDTILVISVISGGPAEKAGLLPFDRIISINDSIFSGKKKNQGEIMKTLRGAKNSTVKLGVQRGNSPELLYFDVTRGDVPVNSVDVSYEAAKGIGYIKVSKFARNTYNEFITAIAKLKQAGCTSFVIDLRGNTGGYMDAAINMINEFMPEGRLIVYTEGKSFPRSDVYANGTGTCKDAPIVVLTDEISASASEIFSGAIQDNDRGTIIGRRTYGKGLVQTQMSLSDGSEMRHLTLMMQTRA